MENNKITDYYIKEKNKVKYKDFKKQSKYDELNHCYSIK